MLISATRKELCLIAIDSGMLHIYVNEQSCTLTELLQRYRARIIDLQRLPLSVGDRRYPLCTIHPCLVSRCFLTIPIIIRSFTCLLSFFYYILLSITSVRHRSTYSLKWYIEFNMKSCIFNCDQVSNKSKEIAENCR